MIQLFALFCEYLAHNNKMYRLILAQVFGPFVISNAVQHCRPILSEGRHSNLNMNGQFSVECDISTCQSVNKVVFEKTDYTNGQFASVYEGFNKTNHHSLTQKDYFLDHRAEYIAFKTRHILFIDKLISKDQGLWRCVVYGTNTRSKNSEALELFFVTPCRPVIYMGSHSRLFNDGHTSLECDISTCDDVLRIVYEKSNISSNPGWTQVYQGIDKYTHHALPTNENVHYSLINRTDFTTFKTRHILYINPFVPADQGQWRCVLYRNDSTIIKSKPLDLYFEISCEPQISNGCHGPLHIGHHTTIECDISTCGPMTKIQFEKTSLFGHEWIKILEGINKTNFHILSTVDDDYSLKNRIDYTVFHTRHVLYIDPFNVNDQGAWRCIAYDLNGEVTTSQSLDVHLASPCKPDILGYSGPDTDHVMSLECDISTCGGVSKVIFEKSDNQINGWMPVYEGIDKSKHQAQDLPTDDYSLSDRAEYAVVHTRHILYINPLIPKDKGNWRCVVYYQYEEAKYSNAVAVLFDLEPQQSTPQSHDRWESQSFLPQWRTFLWASVFCLLVFLLFVVAVVIIYKRLYKQMYASVDS